MNYLTKTLFIVFISQGLGLHIAQDTIKIDLSSSNLKEIQDFSKYASLEEIDLSDNEFAEIPSTIFKENHQLRKINMSGNRKLQFPALGSFLETGAKELNLSHCNLRKIPGNTFDDFTNLDILDLSNNDIDFEISDGFGTMKHLPNTLIVSKITTAGLKNVCRIPQMTIITDEGKVSCSEYVQMDVLVNVDESNNFMDNGNFEDTSLDIMMSDGVPNDEEIEGSGAGESNEVTIKGNSDVIENETEDTMEEMTVAIDMDNKAEEITENEGKLIKDHAETDLDDLIQVSTTIDNLLTNDNIVSKEESEIEEETDKIDETKEIIPQIASFNTRGNFGDETEIIEDKHKSDEVSATIGSQEHDANSDGNLLSSDTHAEIVNKIKAINTDHEPIKSDASTTTSSSSNIAVILVIAVIVVGSVAVSYKCWQKHKKPRYDAVNGALAKEDPSEGKELKEIKIEAEKKPLMPEDHEDGIEASCDCTAKEVINEPEKHTIPQMDEEEIEPPRN